MSRWLREPLLHFLLIGAALFALDATRAARVDAPREGEIVVPEGRVENLLALFAKTWGRAPTPEELRQLVRDHVLEEALYREGLALGLDEGDTVVRSRVRQKMEFVVDDLIEPAAPGDEELAAFLEEHRTDYAAPPRASFRQVFLSRDRRGASLEADAARLLAELRADGRLAEELGDPALFEHAFSEVSSEELARVFGAGFAAALAELPLGAWSGPIGSAYGLHLVHVDARLEGELPGLDELRAALERDWRFEAREAARRRFREELVARYRVEVQWPADLLPAAPAAEDGAQ